MTTAPSNGPGATAAGPIRKPNPVGLALVGLGAACGVLAFSVLDWFGSNVGLVQAGHSTAGDIGDVLDSIASRRRVLHDKDLIHLGLSQYYYSWLAWLLLGAAVIVAVVAALPTSEGGVRALGALLAVLGITATLWALDVYRPSGEAHLGHGPGFDDFVRHTSFGAWAALAAFVLIGAGAVLGPRRVPPPAAPATDPSITDAPISDVPTA